MAEVLDFSNVPLLLKPFIGKTVVRLLNDSSGDVDSDFTTTLLAVEVLERNDVVLTLGYVQHGVEDNSGDVDWMWSHPFDRGNIESLRFYGKSLRELIAEDEVRSSNPALVSFRDSVFEYMRDVHLVTSDGKKVEAHKMILGCRSPVFRAMFNTPMKEKNAKEVSLKENSHGAVEAFVQLLYARPCPTLSVHILEIIELADVYQLGSLEKVAGKNVLLGVLTKDNAAKIWFKSAERNQTEIWKMAMQFMKDNDLILEDTEEWKQMKATGRKMELDAGGISAIFGTLEKRK